MDQIENIFICTDETNMEHLKREPSTSNLDRVKLGEVYKLQNEMYSLICFHCLDEIQYFSEFTLHVEEHLRKIVTGQAEITTQTETIEKTVTKKEIDSTASVTLSIPLQQSSEQRKEFAGYIINPKEEIVHYSDDDQHFGNDDSIDCYTELEKADLPTVEKEEICKKEISTEAISNGRKRQSKSIAKRKKKTPAKIDRARYKLLIEEESKANETATKNIFDKFKSEISESIYPLEMIDSPESRLLAKYSVRKYQYEKIDKFFACPLCQGPFKDVSAVRRHIFSHATKPFFMCPCGELFRLPRYLREHIRKTHRQQSEYECFMCHKMFKSHCTLRVHMQTHSSEDMKCLACNKRFVKVGFYQRHMESVHPEGIQFDVQQNVEPLLDSSKEKTVITMYECYMCRNRTFRERRQLRNHLRNIHSQQPKLCTICGASTSSSTSMNRHMKLHETNEEKPHKCEICFKVFKVRTYLLRHNRKEHNLYCDNAVPVCPKCGQSFANKRLLWKHMKESHPFEGMKHPRNFSKTKLNLLDFFSSETRNFHCSVCNHAARNAYNLRR